MKRTILILIFISALVGTLSCSGKKSEDEPENNERATAQEIRNGQIMEGSYYSATGRDIDYFFIKTQEPVMVTGKMTGVKGVDPEIMLYRKGEKNTFKIINDTLSSLGETFAPIYVESPGVVMAIRPRKAVNQEEYKKLNYEFSVSTFSAPGNSEKEPNDNFESAQMMEESISGYYSNVYIYHQDGRGREIESDYYSLELKNPIKYRLTVKLSEVGGVDPVIRIFDQGKEKILTLDAKGVSQGESLDSYGIEGPGRIYFSVTAKDYKINEKECYELYVTANEYENKFEFEPNDTMEKASLIQEDKTRGEFGQKEDIDWYEVKNEMDYPLNLRLRMEPAERADMAAELYDDKKKKISLFNDGKSEELEAISNRIIPPRSSYYIKLFLAEGSALEGDNGYTLEKSLTNPVDMQETEPNDTKDTADDISLDATMVGYMNPNTDTDFYRLRSEATQKSRIMVDGIDGCAMQVRATDKSGYVTEKKNSANLSSGVSLHTVLEPDSLVIVNCTRTTRNLHKLPYKIVIQKDGEN